LGNSALRFLIAVFAAAVVVGVVMWEAKPRKAPPAPVAQAPDPQQVAVMQAQQILEKGFQMPVAAKFSNYVTDNNTGAAELGSGIWEAWGKVDFRDATGADAHRDWQVAWDRRTGRVIYRKLGAEEIGNYAEALGASKAYPPGPDAAD